MSKWSQQARWGVIVGQMGVGWKQMGAGSEVVRGWGMGDGGAAALAQGAEGAPRSGIPKRFS